MTVKHKYLYLALALVCFLGIILIFIFDGYMGLYDSFRINNGEYPMEIEPDYWFRQDTYWFYSIEWGGTANFTYEIDNRRFSEYVSEIDVSVWDGDNKIDALLSQTVEVDSFGKWQTGWVLDTSEYLSADSSEQNYNFTLLVSHGDIERRIIINVNVVIKPPPAVRSVD
jgi:hypothetical protein